MIEEMLRGGDSYVLNEKTYPNCYLHRSSPNDVARTEHLTFICAPDKEYVGPTNNWMDPGAAKHEGGALLGGAMRGRTMYVVPYVMGPVSSPISKVGVEVTDSPYVVASMRIMSRMGKVAMERLAFRVWTVGDDISWMKIGADGYLPAINPEAGFFGVAPGTGMKTNQNVMGALRKNTLFTNVAMTSEREPWWEGIGSEAPAGLINWKGDAWGPSNGAAAHPNRR